MSRKTSRRNKDLTVSVNENDKKELSIDDVINSLPKFTQSELALLNKKVVEKLKLLAKARQLTAMSNFSLGDKVEFTSEGEKITGTIIRLNQKTVSLVTQEQSQWNVPPSVLTKI